MMNFLLHDKVCLAILLALSSCTVQNAVASGTEGNFTGPLTTDDRVGYFRLMETEGLGSFDDGVLDACNKFYGGYEDSGSQYISKLISKHLALNEAQAAIRNKTKEKYPHMDNISNAVMRQKLIYLLRRGPVSMDSEKLQQMIEIGSNMEDTYRHTLICHFDGDEEPSNCSKIGVNSPGLLMENNALGHNDFEKLEYYWTARQDVISAATPVGTYKKFIDLLNEHAQASGYQSADEVWTTAYNDGNRSISLADFKEQLYSISAELTPFYEKLHAFVRMKLRNSRHGNHISQFIPANLLGSVNSGDWDMLTAFTMPFDSEGNPHEPGTNDLVIEDDRFWTGFSCWPPRFCYERATEFRQKTCQDRFDDEERPQDPAKYVRDLDTYHESHILQAGLNLGFHSAVVDLRPLAFNYINYMSSKAGIEFPNCFYCSKGPTNPSPESTANLNYLYRTALYKIIPLVHTISVLDWKFGVLNGTISPEEYNSKWWESLRQHQGIVPPNDRSNSSGLDAAADLAIASNIEQSHEFIRQVLTFQLFQIMCNNSGQYSIGDASSKPIHECNLIESKDLFTRLTMLGTSKPYFVSLRELTDSDRLSAQPIINYFKPLLTLLDEELVKAGENPGFSDDTIMQRVTESSHDGNETSGTDQQPPAESDSDEEAGMLGGLQALFRMLRAMMT